MKTITRSLYFLLAFSGSLHAKTININTDNVSESYSKTVKVSGTFYLGLQYQAEKVDKLNILFPKNSKGNLCVEIASIDGRYKATIKHHLQEPASNLLELDFPSRSRYKQELREYKPYQLAVKASLSANCDNVAGKNLLASWSANVANKNVLLLIRSDARKDYVQYSIENKMVKCKKYRNEAKVTYDKYCILDANELVNLNELVVKRKNLRNIDDETIPLAY